MRVQLLTYNGHLTGLDSADKDALGSSDTALGQWLKPTLDKATSASRSTRDDRDNQDSTSVRKQTRQKSAEALNDEGADAPDVVAIGFQEMIPLHLALLGLSKATLDAHDFQLTAALSQHYSTPYVVLAKKCLGAIALLVYVRQDKLANVRDVRVASAAFGIANLMGNKGAVGVRIVVNDSDDDEDQNDRDSSSDPRSKGRQILTFVTAHLAAHDSGLERRNRDYQSIVERLVFAHDAESKQFKPLQPLNVFASCDRRDGSNAEQDLNYRLSLKKPKSLPLPSLTHKIQNSDFETLFQYDTLTQQRRLGKTLHGLHEARIDFKPTYKYKVGTVDTFKSFKKRVPGWTDRVVFATWADRAGDERDDVQVVPVGQSSRGDNDDKTIVEVYTSVQEFTRSDHKPVTAIIKLPRARSNPNLGSSQTTTTSQNLRLKTRNPFQVDQTWRKKKLMGWILDRVVGFNWCLLVLLGFNKDARLGVINLALIIFAMYYRS
ncbi:hypothetical protein OIV83_001347 [Microbotryomycetes sp. JL201]|nr:hypothetical protein OIV83_001347 [Microbotryomycetes sp. JL201]